MTTALNTHPFHAVLDVRTCVQCFRPASGFVINDGDEPHPSLGMWWVCECGHRWRKETKTIIFYDQAAA